MAAGLILFAACNTNTPEAGMSESQIDSMVNARVDVIKAEMMAKNDSIINAMAQMKADSMIEAMKGNTVAKKVVPHGNTHAPVETKKNAPAPEKPDNTRVTTRPGASNQTGTSVTDRPGASNNGEPKRVTDRPGASNNH